MKKFLTLLTCLYSFSTMPMHKAHQQMRELTLQAAEKELLIPNTKPSDLPYPLLVAHPNPENNVELALFDFHSPAINCVLRGLVKQGDITVEDIRTFVENSRKSV